MSKKIILPQGASDTLFQRYEKKRKIERRLSDLFEREGYRPLATPTFEYEEVFSTHDGFFSEGLYRLGDEGGRTPVLRPESSAPIARIAGTVLRNASLPLKICYSQNVFKKQATYGGHRHEITQCGVEFIGGDSLFDDDLHIIGIAVSALESTGLGNFKIELGHAKLFSLVCDMLPLTRKDKDRLRRYTHFKNIAALDEMLEPYYNENAQVCELIKRMPRLFGGSEVLIEAKDLLEKMENRYNVKEAVEIAENLQELHKKLVEIGLSDKVSFDLGLVHRLEYYTGIIFSGYSHGFGRAVLNGGRYDKLCAEFGPDRVAIGFAVDVDAALDAVDNERTDDKHPLRIALTKGRLQKKTCDLLEANGIEMSALKEQSRKLILTVGDGKYELILAKAADVITYVTHGVCDVGVAGKDTIREQGGSFYELLDTGLGKCRFALAAPVGFSWDDSGAPLVIATKYPNVARDFMTGKGIDCEIIKIEGSVELAPLLGLADAIVDIVETGETLRANGLEVVEDISHISARCIANIASMKLRKNDIEEFIAALDGGENA